MPVHRIEIVVGSVFVDLIPLIIGAAVVPVHAIIVLLLLRGESGLLKAIAFVSGMIAVRLAQGAVFGLVFGGSGSDNGDESGMIVPTLLLVIGLLMWVTAIRKIRNEDDPDAPPPRWLTMMSGVAPLQAFGYGALLLLIAAKQWVFTLGAINVVYASDLERVPGIVAFLAYVIFGSSLIVTPIALSAIAPGRSATLLEQLGTWLERNNSYIVIAVSVIFGTFFLYRGITGLTN